MRSWRSDCTRNKPFAKLDRIKSFLGYLPPVNDHMLYEDNPFASLFDLMHARERLGFEPKYSARSVVGLND